MQEKIFNKKGKPLGVVILNWNGIRLLKQFLPDAVSMTVSEQADLIVADNGSTDDSVEWIEKNCPEVRIIRLDRNYGFAEGYNKAIDIADYEFITLLNSDVEVTRGWWRPILEFISSCPKVAAVQPKILSWHDKESFEYAGAAGGFLDNLGYPFCRGRLFDSLEKDRGQYDNVTEDITWASGACLTVRRDIYRSLGGMDPLFFAHQEEIDLCFRMLNAGYRVCYVSNSKVYHVGGASLNQGNPQKTYLNFRNNLLLLHKNLPRRPGKRRLFMRRLADTLAFGMFLLKGDWKNAKAVIRAHNDFRKMKKSYQDFPASNLLSRLPGGRQSALWQHFILRRKVFNFK